MAEIKYLGTEALEQIAREVPQLIAGENITFTPDETQPNKITISSTGGGGVTVDSALSDTSENPVQNKAIKSELDTMKQTFQDGVDTVYDATVAKGATPADKTPSAIATAIEELELGIDVSDTTATAADVLVNKKFHTADGTLTDGTIPVYEPYTVTVSSDTTTGKIGNDGTGTKAYIDFPYGYHKQGGDTDFGRIYVNDSLFGTASTADVLSGKSFTSKEGVQKTGTIPSYPYVSNDTIVDGSTSGIGLYKSSSKTGYNYLTFLAGYYKKDTSTTSIDRSGVYIKGSLFGNATAADVMKGKTFTSESGVKITGTAAGTEGAFAIVSGKGTRASDSWTKTANGGFTSNSTYFTTANSSTGGYMKITVKNAGNYRILVSAARNGGCTSNVELSVTSANSSGSTVKITEISSGTSTSSIFFTNFKTTTEGSIEYKDYTIPANTILTIGDINTSGSTSSGGFSWTLVIQKI